MKKLLVLVTLAIVFSLNAFSASITELILNFDPKEMLVG